MSGRTALYRWYDKLGTLLYVGISNDVIRRTSEHQEDKDWWQRVARAQVYHYPSREAALRAEKHTIRQECPLYNVQHNATMQYVAPAERIKTQRYLRHVRSEEARDERRRAREERLEAESRLTLPEILASELTRLLRVFDPTPGQLQRIDQLRVYFQRIEEAPPGMRWHRGAYVPDVRVAQ